MPIGGDLGFSYPILVVLVVGPVIVLVVRRKWRLAVARSEEIKRLLVLASEEAARAELEDSSYVTPAAAISPPVRYQCAVCFRPTTTRCARCKALRYCSSKCQIVHWRQGHKEECRAITTSYQINDMGGGSSQKVLKEEEDGINGYRFETEVRLPAKSVQNFPSEAACSESNCSPEVFCGNHDAETKRSDGHLPTNIYPVKLETCCSNKGDQNRSSSSKKNNVVGSVHYLTGLGRLNQIKTSCSDRNIEDGSTSSSGWSADGTDASSFYESSTPSSGFWEGTPNSSRPKNDVLDDSGQFCSRGGVDGSSSCFNENPVPTVGAQGSDTPTVPSDGAHSTTLRMKKHIERAGNLEGKNGDASKGRNSPLLIRGEYGDMDACKSSDSAVLKSKERTCTSSCSSVGPMLSAGWPSDRTHGSPVRSDYVVNARSNTVHLLESKESGSQSLNTSVANLSSSTRRPSLQADKSGKDDSSHAVDANFSEFASYSPDGRNGLKSPMRKAVDQLKASKSSRHCHLGVVSEIAEKCTYKGLFSYELFFKLYTWNKIELRPCGLTNCGNSCYANAVLQCLACTPPLTAYLFQGLHSKACDGEDWCFTCEFECLILKSKEGVSQLSPIRILSQIQKIGSHLGNGKEEDAHEFLRYAIDAMQSACLKEARVNASRSLEEETTLIGLTFGGYLRSKIKCIKCGGKTEQHERTMDLAVEIGGDIGTLEEALQKFTGTEILDGENKYQCNRCGSYERAKKKLTVLEAPNILTIALKRFQSGKFGKLSKSIRFPEILDLAPYMSRTSDKSPIYRLYGVIVHLDIMNTAFSGHYVCYVKNVQNKWFKIDDSMVKAVELESVLTKGAYMLLYARCSPRAPRLIRNSTLLCDPRKPNNPPSKSRFHPTSHWHVFPNQRSFESNRRILEDDSSSDNSSSVFSEGCSCSTDSSNPDSNSTEDYSDPFFGELGRNWDNLWKNSDSDSSTSSSSTSPSPLYSGHSPIAYSDQCSSRYPDRDRQGFWGRQPSRRGSNGEGNTIVPLLYTDITNQFRKFCSSSNCRETDTDRLGRANPNPSSAVSIYE